MNNRKAPYALGLIALLAAAPALAVNIENVTLQTPLQAAPNTDLDSDHIVWISDEVYAGTGGITYGGQQPPPYDSYLANDASAVGSNIELSTLDDGIGSADYLSWVDGSSRTTLTGDFGVPLFPVTLSSPTLSDWMGPANDMSLAKAYVEGFVVDTLGIPLTDAQLAVAAYVLVSGDTDNDGVPDILSPAYILSDPNINYVALDGLELVIGLAGLLDATDYLQQFADALGIPLIPPTQLSEVVRVDYLAPTSYAFGFSATDTLQDICAVPGQPHEECSYSGNYEIRPPFFTPDPLPTPEPAGIALLAVGIVGLGFSRRRTSAKAS